MAVKTLQVCSLELSRPHGRVLRGIDLHAEPGELVGILGQSGSGKTTVLRAIAALEPFDAGSIQLDGVTLHPGPLPRESRLRALRERVGIVFQHHYLFEHLSALDNVTLAPVHVRAIASEEARRRAEELLESLGVAHRARAFPRELSGGEAQRVAIARALILDPHLLLMDEPTAALDPARRNSLGELLQRLTGTGRAIVMATHDLEFARAFASRIVTLSEGRISPLSS